MWKRYFDKKHYNIENSLKPLHDSGMLVKLSIKQTYRLSMFKKQFKSEHSSFVKHLKQLVDACKKGYNIDAFRLRIYTKNTF